MKFVSLAISHHFDHKAPFLFCLSNIVSVDYTRNNYSNVFIALDALKSLLCFALDIDVNDILYFRTNNLLRKCRKKAITDW